MDPITVTVEGAQKEALAPARSVPRCLAKTRRGSACRCPAVKGGSGVKCTAGRTPGVPRGNRNALKHGLRTAEVARLRALLAELA